MLRLLISEPEIRQAAASKARERVWEHYLWARVAREIEGSYLTLAAGNAPKPAAPASGDYPRAA
jgi:glycosyltransferase involved in cell wall biosynthesis